MSNYPLIIIAVAIGGAIAWISGRRVAMTDMPQMIALYNGMGGGAAAAIAAVELYRGGEMSHTRGATLAVVGGIIGAVSFSGSLIAFGKLQGLISKSLRFRRPADSESADLWRPLWSAAAMIASGYQRHAAGRHRPVRRRAGTGPVDDAADRRRRHAGRDLALQRADRPGGGLRRLRARQRRDDHRRHGGRLRRHAADAADGAAP